ncbi:TRIC cation channel family protein [Olsenella sp. YH-ols2217]|uniref:TRIC cation channel family protein n=1 Tax=Kribbibacterium absianum TaxID=3044210 RepID=A0ABT6ZJK6_9ACTN|nr:MULTISPECIES: TRIC cation channel family protein [unclassified Olsenella]MDJ1122770.1 TRIC cation channel family protein [Olsenella sp. YH-ols2216]MDJ1129247.1 TRIC cation channel family protein [Olsenella sp. YH-ols2217]
MGLIFTQMNPESVSLALPVWIDIAAVLVGSSFGALTAAERKLDLLGALGLGFLCGLGGGLIRDIIMQVGNVYMLRNPSAIAASLVASAFVFFFSGIFRSRRLDKITAASDMLSVALFAASGTDKAIVYGLAFLPAVFMGLMTGVGGGMLRDTFLGDVPQIFRPGNLYALCALGGSCVYWLLVYAGIAKWAACLACVIVVLGLRWASIEFNIVTPADVDFTPKLVHYLQEKGIIGSRKPRPVLNPRDVTLQDNRRIKAYRAAFKNEIVQEVKEQLEAERLEKESSQATGSAEAVFTPESERSAESSDDSM